MLVGSVLLGHKPLNRYPAHHLAVLVLHARLVVSLEMSLPCQLVRADLEMACTGVDRQAVGAVRRCVHAQGCGKDVMQQMSADRRRWTTALREDSPHTSHHMVLWRQGGPLVMVLSMQRSIPRR